MGALVRRLHHSIVSTKGAETGPGCSGHMQPKALSAVGVCMAPCINKSALEDLSAGITELG